MIEVLGIIGGWIRFLCSVSFGVCIFLFCEVFCQIELVSSGRVPARKYFFPIEDYFIAKAEVIRYFFVSFLTAEASYVINWVSPSVLASGVVLGNFSLSLRDYFLSLGLLLPDARDRISLIT